MEFENVVKNYKKRIEQQYKQEMEIMRLQTLYLVDVQLQSKDRFRTVHKLMPFPWDNDDIKDKDIYIPTETDFSEMEKVELDLSKLNTIDG